MTHTDQNDNLAKIVRTEYAYRGMTFWIAKKSRWRWEAGPHSGEAPALPMAIVAAKAAVDFMIRKQGAQPCHG